MQLVKRINNKFLFIIFGVIVLSTSVYSIVLPNILKSLSGENSPFRIVDFRSVELTRGSKKIICQEFKVQGFDYYLTQKHCLEDIAPSELLALDRTVRSDTGEEVLIPDQIVTGLAHIVYELNGQVGTIPIKILRYDNTSGVGIYETLDGSPVPNGVSGGAVLKGSVVFASASAASQKLGEKENSSTGYLTGKRL